MIVIIRLTVSLIVHLRSSSTNFPEAEMPSGTAAFITRADVLLPTFSSNINPVQMELRCETLRWGCKK